MHKKQNNKKWSHKRILLIDPKGFGAGLNLGLGYLAAVLVKNNYRVKVLDFNNTSRRLAKGPSLNLGFSRSDNWKNKIEAALKWKPLAIGISINSFTLQNSLEVIKYCRSIAKHEITYFAGGPHVTMFKKDFLEKNKDYFNFAITGEGEETIIDLLKNINSPKKVKGIIYYDKSRKQIIETEARPLIENLDTLPFPNFEVFDTVIVKDGLYNYQMMSSRGCPYGCIFCFHMWSRKWRSRSPENVLAEIKFAKRKYGMSTITFWDDNFTLEIERAKKICDMLLSEKEKLNLKYDLAGIRADRVDEELINKLKKSGCVGISMGIEDGDPTTFPYVGKGETLEQIEKTAKLIKKYNIPLLTYMITGLINSTYKSFLRSLKFVEKIGVTAHWSIAFPFPETPLFNWVKENGRFLMSLDEGFKLSMTSKNPPVVFDTKAYTKDERIKAYYLGNLRSKSYDMIVSSRSNNFFQIALEIVEAIWKYDRQNFIAHLSVLMKFFSQFLVNFGRIKK